jgi:hypothetical protein
MGMATDPPVRLLRPKNRLAVSESDADTLPDIVLFFTRERENVGQESFDALVHRVSPLRSSPALFLRRCSWGPGPWGLSLPAAASGPGETNRRRVDQSALGLFSNTIDRSEKGSGIMLLKSVIACLAVVAATVLMATGAATGDMELAALC